MPLNPAAPDPAQSQRLYWRAVRWVTGGLLALWFVAAFVVVFFARQLNFDFFGWPFGFWWSAQGALLVFLGLVALYGHAIRRLELAHGVAEQD